MTNDEADLDRMRMLMAAAAERTTCPSADVLARAAAGQATRAERRALADHLATCESCSEEYRVAGALGAWSERASRGRDIADLTDGAEPTGRSPHVRAWGYAAAAALAAVALTTMVVWNVSQRRENARLAAEVQARASVAASSQARSQSESHPSSRLPALSRSSSEPASQIAEQAQRLDAQAAELATLRARLDDALVPALNVPIVDLMPRETARGGASPIVARVPAASRLVTFIISTATDPRASDHQLEIVGPSGTVLWRGSGLRPNAEKTFTVTVPRALLAAGTCRFRLSVVRNGTRRVVGEYLVVMES